VTAGSQSWRESVRIRSCRGTLADPCTQPARKRAAQITIALTDYSGGGCSGIADTVRDALADVALVTRVNVPEHAGGRGYYHDFCFKFHARFADATFETGDGGLLDWTQRLVGSAKERCFISGIGIDRLALAVGSP